MGDTDNPGPAPRQGGTVVGLNQASFYRPITGFNVVTTRKLTDRDKEDLKTNFRLAGWGMRLRITVFTTKAAGDVSTYLKELLDKAALLFRPHGLQIEVRDLTNVPLAKTSGPVTSSEDIDEAIKEVQGNGLGSDLKVIFCARQTANSTGPATDSGITVRDAKGIPYVFINVQNPKPDRVTLAHEMGHASGLHDEPADMRSRFGGGAEAYLRSLNVQIHTNLMDDTSKAARTDMYAYQVKSLGTAQFAVPGNT